MEGDSCVAGLVGVAFGGCVGGLEVLAGGTPVAGAAGGSW